MNKFINRLGRKRMGKHLMHLERAIEMLDGARVLTSKDSREALTLLCDGISGVSKELGMGTLALVVVEDP